MNQVSILVVLALVLTSCKSAPNEAEKQADAVQHSTEQAPKKELAPKPEPKPKPKKKLIGKTSTGKAYIVVRKEKDGSFEYVLNGEGFKFAKETKLLSHAEIKDVLTADLDKDGFDEAYIIYDCVEKGESQPVIAAFVSFKDRAFGPISVRAASAKQLQGYAGNDHVFVQNNQLIREFPIYDGENNTGQKQKIIYTLEAGESGFVLKPSK